MSFKIGIATLAVAILALASSARAAEPAILMSKRELKALLASAKTPEEHMRLAAYYRAEAERLKAKQQQHENEAAEYYRNPSRYPVPKYPTYGQHCRDLAHNYGKGAQKAQALAIAHEAMAAAAREGGSGRPIVTEERLGDPGSALRSKSGDMDCEQMMAKPGQMMSEMTAMDAQLEQKVATMNEATGEGKVDAMAAVINELVSQRRATRDRETAMQAGIAGHMGGATSPEPNSTGECPMMKKTAK